MHIVLKRTLFILFMITGLVSVLVAAEKSNKPTVKPVQNAGSLQRPAIGEDDAPAPVMLSWIGTGRLGTFTISNTGQNGYFEPPVGWPGYTGDFPFGYFSGNGRTGEFPRGSQQYYVWASGIWIGAMVEKTIGDTTILEPRVATGAYYSDQGALSPLYQTNQKISSGDGEGDFLFKQKGVLEAKDYQMVWPYADTTLNARRRAAGHPELQIDPSRGDYLSNEDTYTVWGDYFPEKEASTLFSFGYDTDPVGIRVEQRTYSWSADAYIYLNYRITNMNDFPLRDVYFGYFMDNDVGDAADDLIGYDEDLNLGYSYDSDLQETGWKTLAGYMGTVFIKTPEGSDGNELGLTGFQTWTIDGDEADVDNEEEDDLKYAQLSKGGYEVFSVPQDVRQLTCSGPVVTMDPGETIEVTIMVVAGGSLDEIRRNTISALDRYNKGYIGPEAPPSPKLTVFPGDHRVILNWDKSPEVIPDPFTGQVDFEGYRLYRSTDGGLTWGDRADDSERYPSGWNPVAEFDIAGDQTERYVATSVISDTSSATIGFEGFTSNVDDYYRAAKYTIEFQPDRTIRVFNLNQLKSYLYNSSALSDGDGFAIVHRDNVNSAYPDATYHSGEYITFDGIFVSITDDSTFNEITQTWDISTPAPRAVFSVETFDRTQIGDQVGLDYVYEDDKLTNGLQYTYAVTAFDKGDPTIGLPSLESAIPENKINVVPRGTPADRTVESLSNVTRVSGISNGAVNVVVKNPLKMVNADYRVEFFGSDTVNHIAAYLKLIDTTVDTVVADSVALNSGSAQIEVNGLILTASGPATASIDTNNFSWKGTARSQGFDIIANKPQPFDYEIEFVNDPQSDPSTYSGDETIFPPNTLPQAPWTINLVDKTEKPKSYSIPPISSGFNDGITLRIMRLGYKNANDFVIGLATDLADTTNPIQSGDVFQIKTLKPFLTNDVFTFNTKMLNDTRASYALDDIKVVPNPYYVRAQWDTDRFNKHIKFTHLPQACTIRIFTVSGILIKTIEHNENTGDQAGYHRWNLRNEENLDIASGLYLFQVKDKKTGKEKIGKFAIVL